MRQLTWYPPPCHTHTDTVAELSNACAVGVCAACSALQGDYRCIYPTADPLKAEHFDHLLREAARVSLAGAPGLRRKSDSQALLGLKVGMGEGREERGSGCCQ